MHKRISLQFAVIGLLLLALPDAATAVVVGKLTAVTPAQKPYPVELIVANVQTAVGKEFNPQALSDDIERLYKTGYFKYVDTRVADEAGGKSVVFIVEPLPRVKSIAFEGNASIKTKTLRKAVATKEGDLLVAKTVSADTRQVLQKYRDKGFHRTKVELVEQAVANEQAVNLIWKVAEEPRYKVRKVLVEGNTAFTDRQLRKVMLTKASMWSYVFKAGFHNERKFDVDQRNLLQLYEDSGYLDATFALREDVEENGKWIVLTVAVAEGKPYNVSTLNLAGNKLFGEDELMPLASLAAGQPYSQSKQRADTKAIQDKYRPLGYLAMTCRARLDKDAANQTVAIVYEISEGVPSRIRDIYIGGNHDTKDEVIRRELRIQPTDLADANKLEASKRVLLNLGYFEEVTISPRTVPGDDSLTDLDITVKEGATGTFTFGGGFSDSDGFVLSAEVTKSNFDLRRFFSDWPPQAGGGGQRMRLMIQAGTDREDFIVSFIEPWFLDRKLRLETSVFGRGRDYDEYYQTNTGADVMISREWRPNWRQSFGLRADNVEIDDVEDLPPLITVGGVPVFSNQELLDEEGNYWSNSLIYGMRRDTRNAFYNPTQGSRLDFRTRVAPQALGSYSDVYALDLSATKYFPVARNSTLRLHGQVGVVDKMGGDPVAIFDRYFAGGADSIRGFRWRDVGPVDANEDPLGGQSIFVGSVEYIYVFRNISENLRGSLFCDFGNVWEDAYDFDGEINASVGVGLEINLPMGRGSIPIRLDYGWPIVTQEDHLGDSGRFHFNFGYHY